MNSVLADSKEKELPSGGYIPVTLWSVLTLAVSLPPTHTHTHTHTISHVNADAGIKILLGRSTLF